jgi:hypothetical protein
MTIGQKNAALRASFFNQRPYTALDVGAKCLPPRAMAFFPGRRLPARENTFSSVTSCVSVVNSGILSISQQSNDL